MKKTGSPLCLMPRFVPQLMFVRFLDFFIDLIFGALHSSLKTSNMMLPLVAEMKSTHHSGKLNLSSGSFR